MVRAIFILLLTFCCSTLYAAQSLAHLTNIQRAPAEDTALLSIAGVGEFISISNPVAVSAHGNLVYIVDASKQIVYRYNTSTESLTPLYSVTSHMAGVPNAIAVAEDGSFFVSDPFGLQVLHFSMQGELIRQYKSAGNLSNTVAITLNAAAGVLVADRLYDHVLVFNRVGQVTGAFGQRGTGKGQFLEVIDMATGPDGIYVLDRLTKSVKVFSAQGTLLRLLERPEVIDPTAIAVDYAERVYISDGFDDTIKIYDRNGLIEIYGGTGSQNGMFRMVTDMHVDNNFLYVADSANNRVQVFLLKAAFTSENDEQ